MVAFGQTLRFTTVDDTGNPVVQWIAGTGSTITPDGLFTGPAVLGVSPVVSAGDFGRRFNFDGSSERETCPAASGNRSGVAHGGRGDSLTILDSNFYGDYPHPRRRQGPVLRRGRPKEFQSDRGYGSDGGAQRPLLARLGGYGTPLLTSNRVQFNRTPRQGAGRRRVR